MTEEQYVLMNGGDAIIGQSIIYQSSHASRSVDVKDIDDFNKRLGEIVEINHKLRVEFRKKVASGEIHEDTVVERLIATAHGHEDNEATWAARRCLQKRGVIHSQFIENSMKKRREEAINQYKDGGYKQIIDIDREKLTNLIKLDLTIPQIKEAFPDNTYEEIYDTILCDDEFNALYRQHGQKKVKKPKK